MSPRTGRPRSDDPRAEIITVRFTAGEYAEVKAAVEASGKPVSVWIREASLRTAKRARKPSA